MCRGIQALVAPADDRHRRRPRPDGRRVCRTVDPERQPRHDRRAEGRHAVRDAPGRGPSRLRRPSRADDRDRARPVEGRRIPVQEQDRRRQVDQAQPRRVGLVREREDRDAGAAHGLEMPLRALRPPGAPPRPPAGSAWAIPHRDPPWRRPAAAAHRGGPRRRARPARCRTHRRGARTTRDPRPRRPPGRPTRPARRPAGSPGATDRQPSWIRRLGRTGHRVSERRLRPLPPRPRCARADPGARCRASAGLRE